MAVQCPVCEGSRCHRAGEYRRRGDGLAADALMACEDCGLTFAFPLPSPGALEEYNTHYWLQAHGGLTESKLAWATDAGLNAVRAGYIVERVGSRLPRSARVLEIGPGRGYLLSNLKATADVGSYVAIESDASCHDRLRTLGAVVHSSLDRVLSEPRFHLIILSHVLEHMSDPMAFLTPIVERLEPGGCLFIETPCRDHTFKAVHEPHLLFFDKPPMRKLLERLECDVIAMTYHGPVLDQLSVPESFLGRIGSRLRERALTLMLAGRQVDGLAPPMLARCTRHLEADREKTAPSWWLRTIAVKRRAASWNDKGN